MIKLYKNSNFSIYHSDIYNLNTRKVIDIVDLFSESSNSTKANLKISISNFILLVEKVKKEFNNINAFYIHSSYRKQDNNRPHREGRALDISRIQINDIWYHLINTTEYPEWYYLWDLCTDAYNNGIYSQIISPYGCLDKWNNDNRKKQLISSHQDHFHIGLTP